MIFSYELPIPAMSPQTVPNQPIFIKRFTATLQARYPNSALGIDSAVRCCTRRLPQSSNADLGGLIDDEPIGPEERQENYRALKVFDCNPRARSPE